jgi:hypothetical protein
VTRAWLKTEMSPSFVRERNSAYAAKEGLAAQAGIETLRRHCDAKRESDRVAAEVPEGWMERQWETLEDKLSQI